MWAQFTFRLIHVKTKRVNNIQRLRRFSSRQDLFFDKKALLHSFPDLFLKNLVLEGRLELPRIAPLAPQASASAIPPPEHFFTKSNQQFVILALFFEMFLTSNTSAGLPFQQFFRGIVLAPLHEFSPRCHVIGNHGFIIFDPADFHIIRTLFFQ